MRIPVPAAISLSGVAVWLLSGLRRHFLLWHRRLLLNSRLLNRLDLFRHLLWLRLSRRGLLCRLLRLGLLAFPHHCEEISLSH